MIDLPTLSERAEHFQMYLGKLKMEQSSQSLLDAVSDRMAALTPGERKARAETLPS